MRAYLPVSSSQPAAPIKRYKAHTSEILLLILMFADTPDTEQGLRAQTGAHRYHQASADCQLLFQGFGYFRSTRSNHNSIKWCMLWPAQAAIAIQNLDVS